MNCCTCAPVAVTVIYTAMDKLAKDTRVCPFALAEARAKLVRIEERREERQRRIAAASLTGRQGRPRRRVA
jgi:hypothetical protein